MFSAPFEAQSWHASHHPDAITHGEGDVHNVLMCIVWMQARIPRAGHSQVSSSAACQAPPEPACQPAHHMAWGPNQQRRTLLLMQRLCDQSTGAFLKGLQHSLAESTVKPLLG